MIPRTTEKAAAQWTRLVGPEGADDLGRRLCLFELLPPKLSRLWSRGNNDPELLLWYVPEHELILTVWRMKKISSVVRPTKGLLVAIKRHLAAEALAAERRVGDPE